MRHLRKEPKKPFKVIIILLVLIIAAGAAAAFLVPQIIKSEAPKKSEADTEISYINSEKETSSKTDETTSGKTNETDEVITTPLTTEKTKPTVRDYTVVELIDGAVETPYCTINYPEGLADNLVIANTGSSPYTLEFYAVLENRKELRLFDISIGENSGGNMGKINTEEGNIPLNVNIYTLPMDESWSESEMNTVYAMRDVINDILNQFERNAEDEKTNADEAEIIINQPEDSGTIGNIKIETPVCPIYYPSEFESSIKYISDGSDNEVYKVCFYSELEGVKEKLLFSVYFGGDEGQQLGVVMGENETPVPVYLIMNEIDTEDLNGEQKELIYAMQEACNQLIDRLPLLDADI